MVSKYLSTLGSSTECLSTVASTADSIVWKAHADVVTGPRPYSPSDGEKTGCPDQECPRTDEITEHRRSKCNLL